MYPARRWLICTNLFFAATALVLLIVVFVSEEQLNGSYHLINAIFDFPIDIILIYALISLLMALSALCGLHQQWYYQLFVYCVTVGMLMIVELVVGILGFVWKPELVHSVLQSLSAAERFYTNITPARDIWDSVQSDFTCCGVYNHTEWFPHLQNLTLPESCCVHYTFGCGLDAVKTGNFYQTTCAMAITRWATNSEIAIGFFFWLIIVLKLVSFYWFKLYLDFLAVQDTSEDPLDI